MNFDKTEIGNPALGDLGSTFEGQGGATFLEAVIRTGITIVFSIGFLFFIFMLLTGGIDWIRAGADKSQLEAARGKLSNALVGLVVLVAGFALIRLIEAVFTIDILNITIPTLLSTGGQPAAGGGGAGGALITP